jgi:hypothetical protein
MLLCYWEHATLFWDAQEFLFSSIFILLPLTIKPDKNTLKNKIDFSKFVEIFQMYGVRHDYQVLIDIHA